MTNEEIEDKIDRSNKRAKAALEKKLTRCDRCREKTGDAVRTMVTIERQNQNAEITVEVCDECYESLRFWLYGS